MALAQSISGLFRQALCVGASGVIKARFVAKLLVMSDTGSSP